MSVRLTDEQVAGLLRGVNEGKACKALALEVQANRKRRCENCQHVGPSMYGHGLQCSVLSEGADGESMQVAPDWFCADFTPKDGAK